MREIRDPHAARLISRPRRLLVYRHARITRLTHWINLSCRFLWRIRPSDSGSRCGRSRWHAAHRLRPALRILGCPGGSFLGGVAYLSTPAAAWRPACAHARIHRRQSVAGVQGEWQPHAGGRGICGRLGRSHAPCLPCGTVRHPARPRWCCCWAHRERYRGDALCVELHRRQPALRGHLVSDRDRHRRSGGRCCRLTLPEMVADVIG